MTNQYNVSNQYLEYIQNRHDLTLYDQITETISSLQNAVCTVGGSPNMFKPKHLSEMTALDLITTIAPNGVRFTVPNDHDSY